MKSEPSEFGIEDLKARGTEPWEGVRNYQARNYIRQMQRGDLAFLYHSGGAAPGIAGIMTIAGPARPDPAAFDPRSRYHDPGSRPESPRWFLVDVRYKRRLRRVITLAELRRQPALGDMKLLQRGNRLSVLPVSPSEWEFILSLE